MINQLINQSFSLLIIIVSRGKGSKILKYAQEKGVQDASCLLGKGTINNKMLQMIEMNDVEKEIILIMVSTALEDEILQQLNMKFRFDKKNQGIAFTLPLAGVMKIKKDVSAKWRSDSIEQNTALDYAMLLIIVDKGKAESVIKISQDKGYYGGTIIKARGSAGDQNILLDMLVEPEKEAVLMLMEKRASDHLASLLFERLQLNQPNTGFLVKAGVGKTIGLFQNSR